MDKQIAPRRKYHPPYEDECPAQPMSAPRTNAEESNPLAGGCRCPAPCVAHPELMTCNAPPLNETWDDLTLAEKAHRMAEALWAEVQAQPPKGDPPTVTVGYLFAANICGVLRKCAAAALRKEPPALPAEVEAVLMQMKIASGRLYGKTVDVMEEAATLLRRYAQAVAEKDGAKCPCDVHACLATVAEKDADRKHFRARVFLASSGGSSSHSTGCTIWGDDGQGHTEEGFTQPLPCNCGALVNFHKKEVATLQSEAREKDAEIARLTGIEKRAKSYRALLTPGSYCEISECQVFDDMTAILWEEH